MSTASTARRKANEAAFRKLRRKHARIAGRQPLQDPEYLEFIRGFHCIVCSHGLIWITKFLRFEAAHVGTRGLRQKCSDRETLPLCPEHHRTGKDAHHVLGKLFFEHHGLDRDALLKDFQDMYEAKGAHDNANRNSEVLVRAERAG